MKIIEKENKLLVIEKFQPTRDVKCIVEFCGKEYKYSYKYDPELLQELKTNHRDIDAETELLNEIKRGAYYEVVHMLSGKAYDAFCKKSQESYPDKEYFPWDQVTTNCTMKATYESVVHSVEVMLQTLGFPSSLDNDYLDKIEYISLKKYNEENPLSIPPELPKGEFVLETFADTSINKDEV